MPVMRMMTIVNVGFLHKCSPLFSFGQNTSHLQVFSSVAQSCPTLWDSMNRSTPGPPVHHQLLSLLKLMPIESVMPSSHLILCRPLLLLPPIPPSIRVFSNESSLFKPHPFIAYFLTPSNQLPSLFPLNPHVLFPLELIFFHILQLFLTF